MITPVLALAALTSWLPPAAAATPGVAPVPAQNNDPPRRRAQRDPWSWRLVGAHYGTGVMTSLLVLPGSYALAGWVGHRGKGLGPVVGAMLIGALVPPALVYTTQWAVGRRLAPGRHRYWPGSLVSHVGHLAVFAGAVLGGASFHDLRDAAPVVLTNAVVVTGLASLTAEATRRPAPLQPSEPELGWQRQQRLWAPVRFEIVVPVLEVQF